MKRCGSDIRQDWGRLTGWHGLLILLAVVALAACGGDWRLGIYVKDKDKLGDGGHATAKNVIVMINSGAGWGSWHAAAYWQYGALDKMPYADFPVRYGMSTYPLNLSETPTKNDDSLVNYDKTKAWSTSRVNNSKNVALPFAGYQYLARYPVGSAAAATGMASGIKTYNDAINFDNHQKALPFITQTAKKQGKQTGIVTTVPFSYATPAAFGAQNVSRGNYRTIANQMLTEGNLDLIMGTGAPGYNINGTPCDQLVISESTTGCLNPHTYLSKEDWESLQAGSLRPKGAKSGWVVLRTQTEFDMLADGLYLYTGPVLGVPEVASTLQQQRQVSIVGRAPENPSGHAYIRTVPTLATMTAGAVQYLSRDANGFFLMVSSGATDWAALTSNCEPQGENANKCTPEYGRLIEETASFNDAVQTVVNWIEANSNWDETLLIVTADHDSGALMGQDADREAFQAISNNGKGKLPGMSFRPTGEHTNALVPLWARGAGAAQFERRVRDKDRSFAHYVGHNDAGEYIDNTDVYEVLKAVLLGRRVAPYEPE